MAPSFRTGLAAVAIGAAALIVAWTSRDPTVFAVPAGCDDYYGGLNCPCTVEPRENLVFSVADDPLEDERYPSFELPAPPLPGCTAPDPQAQSNPERWKAYPKCRAWNLRVKHSGGSSADSKPFRLVISSRPPQLPNLEDYAAFYDTPVAGRGYSDCLPCYPSGCDWVQPQIYTGNIPGQYSTIWEGAPCTGGGSGPCDTFVVCRLDANGPEPGTEDKFPDVAEVLPKRGGFASCPVIRIRSPSGDGYRSGYRGCSLFGTIADGTNVWTLEAIARDPADLSKNPPDGHWFEWDFDDGSSAWGGPVVTHTYSQGRFNPKLFVKRYDPATGQTVVVGKAEIHTITVQSNAWTPIVMEDPQPAPEEMVGSRFHVDLDVGGCAKAVTCKAEAVRRTGAPGTGHPDFPKQRGRVSPDGYPQNEYWVGEDDSYDLPQVFGVATSQPKPLFLQGYQAPSVEAEDLVLKIAGYARLQACSASQWECAWWPTDAEPFQSALPIELHQDGRAWKFEEELPDEIEVPADHVAPDYYGGGEEEDYEAIGWRSRVNFNALVPWAADEIDPRYGKGLSESESFKIEWEYVADPENFCVEPDLQDLQKGPPGLPNTTGRIEAVLNGLLSTVQLDFGKAAHGQVIAHAGDRFCIVAHGKLSHPSLRASLGTKFWDSHQILIVPGDKTYHITVPRPGDPGWFDPTTFDPSGIFALEHEAGQPGYFAQTYGSLEWVCPLGSGHEQPLHIFAFDRYLNPLPAERDVVWTLEGGGRLRSAQSQPPADPNREQIPAANDIITKTDAKGHAEIVFTQRRYPSCPWQVEERPEPSKIFATIDGAEDLACRSKVSSEDAPPAALPEPVLQMAYVGPADLDLAQNPPPAGIIRARLTRGFGGAGISGETVSFTSTNGELTAGEVTTDANGWAQVTLTAAGARLDREDRTGARPGWRNFGSILVTASVSHLMGQVSTEFCPTPHTTCSDAERPRWVDSRSERPTLAVEHGVLVHDMAGADSYSVETLTEEGEMDAPEVAAVAQAGDGLLTLPLHRHTRIVVHGAPSHTYQIEPFLPPGVPDDPADPEATAAVRAGYPLELLVAWQSPSDLHPYAPPALARSGTELLVPGKKGNCMMFNGSTGGLTVPDQPAVRPQGGIQISLWVASFLPQQAVLLERGPQAGGAPDDYRLEVLQSGRLRLTAGPNQAQVESDGLLVPGLWTYVELRISESFAKLAVGSDPEHLDSVFTPGAPGAFGPNGWDVSVAQSAAGTGAFCGCIDEIQFARGGFSPAGATLWAPVAGAPPGAGEPGVLISDNRITTDSHGRAEFFFAIDPVPGAETESYLPVTYVISVSGSGEARATVQSVPARVWAGLVSVGRALLFGEESLTGNSCWYQRVAAWVGKHVPVLSNLRDLALEIYKGATGCDEVHYLELGFSVVGLVADLATFGTAGTALKGATSALYPLYKVALREFAESATLDLACQGAMGAFAQLAMGEIMTADGGGEPAPRPWVVQSRDFIADVASWAQNPDYDHLVEAGLRSPRDAMILSDLRSGCAQGQVEETFGIVNDVDAALAVASLERPRGAGSGMVCLLDEVRWDLSSAEIGVHWATIRRHRRTMDAVLAVARQSGDFIADRIQDAKAWRGLAALTVCVSKREKLGVEGGQIAQRVIRFLHHVEPKTRVKQVLEDFADIYAWAQGDPARIKKARHIAVMLAARSDSAWHRAGQIKGALGDLQASRVLKQEGHLADPFPLHPTKGTLWWDKTTTLNERLEIKNYADIRKMVSDTGPQLGIRVEKDPSILALTGVEQLFDPELVPWSPKVWYFGDVDLTPKQIERLKAHIVQGILRAKDKWDPQRVRAWVDARFEVRRLLRDYTVGS